MTWIDWMVVAIPFLVVLGIGFITQYYTRGVDDFLAGGRGAGRYLLSICEGAAGLGLISIIGQMEMYYNSGYALDFWNQMVIFTGFVLALTGFIGYRYRETRCVTMAEFFEKRYSRGFRIFVGILAFTSGVVNYALFPAVGGRFLVYYCNLPTYFQVCGMSINTYGFVMAVFLIFALIIVTGGGQMTTMVTDCCQGIFGYFGYTAIVIAILCFFSFVDIEEAILSRPEGMSYFNPFNIDKLAKFNILFVFISIFAAVYSRNAWLGSQGYMCAAKNPHEQKMAGLLGTWRTGFVNIMLVLIVIGTYTYMNASAHSAGAEEVNAHLVERITSETVGGLEQTAITIRKQMLVPIALKSFLPVGLVGVFCAIAIFLMVSTDTTYLHSWGTILVQDVVLPIYNKPISQKMNILLLRIAIVLIAIFAWVFSFYFNQSDFILLFFALTGTVYLGGAGACIIGGLYWKKGTTAGAFTAMLLGAVWGVGGFFLTAKWEGLVYPFLHKHAPVFLENLRLFLMKAGEKLPFVNWNVSEDVFYREFPISGQEIYFLGMISALLGYVLISYLTHKNDFDLEKMLNRGKYNIEHVEVKQAPKSKKAIILDRLVSISPEYTKGDKILAWSVLIWTLFNLLVIFVQLICNLCFGVWSEKTWFNIWKYYNLPLGLLVGAVTTVWFTCGCTRDLYRLLKELKENYKKSQKE